MHTEFEAFDDIVDENYFDNSWLDNTYSGAPDECNIHWPQKVDSKGNCPICEENNSN